MVIIKHSSNNAAINKEFLGEPGLQATLQNKSTGNQLRMIDRLDGQYGCLIIKKLLLKKFRSMASILIQQSPDSMEKLMVFVIWKASALQDNTGITIG